MANLPIQLGSGAARLDPQPPCAVLPVAR